MGSNMSLEALKSHLFETLEGVKNLSDPEASENEKISIEQAKQIVDVSGAIIDIFKVQVDAVKAFAEMGNAQPAARTMAARTMVAMGFIGEEAMKQLQ